MTHPPAAPREHHSPRGDARSRWYLLADAFMPVIARVQAVAGLIDRLAGALDDLAKLTAAAKRLCAQLDALAATAEHLNANAATISRDAVVIADALPSIERLATFVDRIPGAKRRTITALHQRASPYADRCPHGHRPDRCPATSVRTARAVPGAAMSEVRVGCRFSPRRRRWRDQASVA